MPLMMSQPIEDLIIYKDWYLEQGLHIKDRNVSNRIKTFVYQSMLEDKATFITMGYWPLYSWNCNILKLMATEAWLYASLGYQ